MKTANQTHDEKETLKVDVLLPGHDDRVTTSLFLRTKKNLAEKVGNKCFVCGRTPEEVGAPHEAHHHPIERSFAEMIDFELVKKDFPNFDWESFDPKNPYSFVDNMEHNGLLLCKEHHTAVDAGIHDLPFPIWIAQKYGKEGYKFSEIEIIHHQE